MQASTPLLPSTLILVNPHRVVWYMYSVIQGGVAQTPLAKVYVIRVQSKFLNFLLSPLLFLRFAPRVVVFLWNLQRGGKMFSKTMNQKCLQGRSWPAPGSLPDPFWLKNHWFYCVFSRSRIAPGSFFVEKQFVLLCFSSFCKVGSGGFALFSLGFLMFFSSRSRPAPGSLPDSSLPSFFRSLRFCFAINFSSTIGGALSLFRFFCQGRAFPEFLSIRPASQPGRQQSSRPARPHIHTYIHVNIHLHVNVGMQPPHTHRS